MAKELIAFYSRADENYVNGTVQTLTIGNTERVAKMIHELTGRICLKLSSCTPMQSVTTTASTKRRTTSGKTHVRLLRRCRRILRRIA